METNKYSYEHARPAVTVDIAVFSSRDEGFCVLLIKRMHAPFAGAWALPGGFVDENEDLADAAKRELAEETSLSDIKLSQVGAFGAPGRDPRGHTVTVAYVGILEDADSRRQEPRAGDDAAEASWFPVNNLPTLAFDHKEIIESALRCVI